MKPIRVEDIGKMTDIIMELPAFTDLSSKNNIKEVLDLFLEDVYTKSPQEIMDMFGFELSKRLQDTFFSNYGIQKNYTKKLKSYLKKDIAYQLEQLFQNKGSNQIFKMFAGLFENIFRKINFYNIKVFKVPHAGGFTFEYRLVPIYITDENNVIEYPSIQIKKTKKYLMELYNFEEYTAWPMSTNLVYIQLSIGEEIINNKSTFLDGARSYGTTYLQGKYLEYKNRFGYTEDILASDVEMITNYFKMEIVKSKNPSWDFSRLPLMSTNLPWSPDTVADPNYPEHQLWTQDRESFMQNMQQLLNDYASANIRDRSQMENIRRRWQMFLKLKETNTNEYPDYQSTWDYINTNYPLMQADFLYNLEQDDVEPLLDFYIYIYSIFLSGVFANPENPALGLDQEIVVEYIDVLFGGLFIEANFLELAFNPVMDLFIKYFFPIEMEYLNDLVNKVLIRDKFNAFSYDYKLKFIVEARNYSIQTPIRKIDWHLFELSMSKHSDVYTYDNLGSVITHPVIDDISVGDRTVNYSTNNLRENLRLEDVYDVRIFNASNPLPAGPIINQI